MTKNERAFHANSTNAQKSSGSAQPLLFSACQKSLAGFFARFKTRHIFCEKLFSQKISLCSSKSLITQAFLMAIIQFEAGLFVPLTLPLLRIGVYSAASIFPGSLTVRFLSERKLFAQKRGDITAQQAYKAQPQGKSFVRGGLSPYCAEPMRIFIHASIISIL